jgi:hypothetical protein
MIRLGDLARAAASMALGIYSLGFGSMLLLFDARILVLWPAGDSPSGIAFSPDRIFPLEVSFFLGAGALLLAAGSWAIVRIFSPKRPGSHAPKYYPRDPLDGPLGYRSDIDQT